MAQRYYVIQRSTIQSSFNAVAALERTAIQWHTWVHVRMSPRQAVRSATTEYLILSTELHSICITLPYLDVTHDQ